jgi:hypothetical protein
VWNQRRRPTHPHTTTPGRAFISIQHLILAVTRPLQFTFSIVDHHHDPHGIRGTTQSSSLDSSRSTLFVAVIAGSIDKATLSS